VCSYILPGYAASVKNGANIYNPGLTFQPKLQYLYQQNPAFGGIQSITQPLEAIFQVKVSL